MVWIIVIAILVFIIYKATHSNNSYNNSSSYSRSSTTTTVSTPAHRPTPKPDSLEDQNVYTCLARFYGAINAIRNANSHQSSIQRGYYSIYKNENGTYGVSGGYDHDSDYRIEEALRNGGYLQYYGLTYVSEGMNYRIDGIHDMSSPQTANGNDYYLSQQYLSIAVTNLRNNVAGLVITNSHCDGKFLSIDFKFAD